jgi:hypothetical protein
MPEPQPSDARPPQEPTAGETPTLPPAGTAPCEYGATRYRLVRLHAQGGLGEVHVAQDTELSRAVALKCIRAECRADPRSVQRFLR